MAKRRVSAAEQAYLAEMRSAPFAPYRWERATGSTRHGHPAAGAPHYGVVSAEHVLYRVPMIPLFRHAPGEPDPTFFLNTETCGTCELLLLLIDGRSRGLCEGVELGVV